MKNAIYPSLKDKVVFISGGASGIGESIVRHFAEQGCKVGFVDIADDAAKALIADIGPQAKLHYEHCDVTDIAALQRAIDAVRQALGPITSWSTTPRTISGTRSTKSRLNSGTIGLPSTSSTSSLRRRRSIPT